MAWQLVPYGLYRTEPKGHSSQGEGSISYSASNCCATCIIPRVVHMCIARHPVNVSQHFKRMNSTGASTCPQGTHTHTHIHTCAHIMPYMVSLHMYTCRVVSTQCQYQGGEHRGAYTPPQLHLGGCWAPILCSRELRLTSLCSCTHIAYQLDRSSQLDTRIFFLQPIVDYQ